MGSKQKFILKHENVIDFNALNDKLIKTYWGLVVLVLVTQIIDSILLVVSGEYVSRFWRFTYSEYIINQIVTPSLLLVANNIVSMVVTKFLGRKKQFALQAFVSIINITLSAIIIATNHYMISGIFFIFIFPPIVSLIYVDRKPVIFAFVISISSYILTAILFLFPKAATEEIKHGVMEFITTIAFICTSTALAMYILNLNKVFIMRILDERQKSKTDSLTGLLNHAAFYEELDKSIMDMKNNGYVKPLSIIVWDLDNFKQINDLHGHSVGDEVILAFVSAVKKTDSSILAFRYGGEEFAFILREDAQKAFEIAEDVRKEFEICSKLDNFLDGATVSSGICEYDYKNLNGKRAFFAAADEALYSAKKDGKNKSVIYSYHKNT